MDYKIYYRKKDGGWQAIVNYKDNQGKWRQRSKQGFKTQKEAKPVINKLLKEIRQKLIDEREVVNVDYNTITFKQLSDEYVEHEKLYKEYNTIIITLNSIKSFKALFDLKIINIKKAHIVKCVDEMIKKKLSKGTIKNYLSRLRLILKYYQINYNPSYSLDFDIEIPDTISKKKKALTRSELDTLIKSKYLKQSKYYIVIYIAANTGMRAGEIMGLTWNDINKEGMYIDVNKQWKINKETGKYGFGKLKSKNSYRKIPITPNFIKELDKYKSEHAISMDNRIAPFESKLATNETSKLLRKKAGISIHELRHTYITLLVQNGVDFKTVAKIAGHDVSETLKTYSHVNDDMMKIARETIKNIF